MLTNIKEIGTTVTLGNNGVINEHKNEKDNSEYACIDVETRPEESLLEDCDKKSLLEKISEEMYGKMPAFAIAVNEYFVKNALREKYIFDTDKHEENTCLKRKVENILPKVKVTNDGDFILDAPTIYSSSEVVGKFISREDEGIIDIEIQPEVAKTLEHIYFSIDNINTKLAHIRREYIRDKDKEEIPVEVSSVIEATPVKDDITTSPIDTLQDCFKRSQTSANLLINDNKHSSRAMIYAMLKPFFNELLSDLQPFCERPSEESYIKIDNNVVGLLYSGGKDSTCRLLELLFQGKSVVPIVNTFNANSTSDLLSRDISICYTLHDIYKNRGSYSGKLYRPKFLTYQSYLFDSDRDVFCQQQYNALLPSLAGTTFLRHCEKIEMCFILGDQGVSYMNELNRIFRNGLVFNRFNYLNNSKLPKLEFPYIKFDKDEIIVKLDKYLKRIHANEDGGYIDRNSENTLYIPSCQQPQIHSITIQYRNDNTYLRIGIRDCGYCHDCKTDLHVLRNESDFEYALYVPLKAVAVDESSFANISTELLRNIVYKTSDLYTGYNGHNY